MTQVLSVFFLNWLKTTTSNHFESYKYNLPSYPKEIFVSQNQNWLSQNEKSLPLKENFPPENEYCPKNNV